MSMIFAIIAVTVVAYALGSIPAGYIAGKMLQGIDIREHGSGSTGATNVLRTLGKGPALVVFLFDVLKGVAAIYFARWFCVWIVRVQSGSLSEIEKMLIWAPWVICLAGILVLLGHSKSIWLQFTGGKSIATGLGVLLAISWPVGLAGLAVFALELAILRFVSLGSILAALTAMVVATILDLPLAFQILVYLGGIYVIWRHKANISRLLAGTEPKVGQKAKE